MSAVEFGSHTSGSTDCTMDRVRVRVLEVS
jgi:hypothetical protein